MPLTKAELKTLILATCPHCRAGAEPELRSTGEYQHSFVSGSGRSTTICWADGLRRSELALKATD